MSHRLRGRRQNQTRERWCRVVLKGTASRAWVSIPGVNPGCQSRVSIPAALLTSHCALDKLINLSMVWFLRFLNEGNSIYFTHTRTRSLKQFLEQNKYKYYY